MLIESEQAHRDGAHDEPDQGAGNARVPALGQLTEREHADSDEQRKNTEMARAADHIGDSLYQISVDGVDPHDGGQLADDNMNGDAGEKSGDHGNREEVGDPARAQDSREQQNDAD